MSRVFVLDTDRKPLMPCTSARARILLRTRKAAVFRCFPFTIILKHAVPEPQTQPLRLKVDPGSKTSGIAVVNNASGEVVFAADLAHRGQQVKVALDERRAHRRSRRQRHTRYRAPRFDNRRRPKGWIPPSLESRVGNILTWVARLRRLCPITDLSQELVRFDLQGMWDPEICGVGYQRGTLAGYEVREYLLEKWGRACAYCAATGVPLQIEHILPKVRGGTDQVFNLTLACAPCNLKKGSQTAEEFGHPDVQKQATLPLRDATAVNTTRWELYQRLQATGLPTEVGSGGRTKYNRCVRELPKTHWLDAVCVGASTPQILKIKWVQPLLIKATGRGTRQMCRMDRYGFPRTKAKAVRLVSGFRTGDIARAVVTSGTKVGTYTGRVAIRASGAFNITTARGTVQGLNVRFFTVLHRADGYNYTKSHHCR